MPDTTFIYALYEPDTGNVRYIGKANDPHIRFLKHLKFNDKTHRSCWIESLIQRGIIPKLQILLEVKKSEWEFWERDMIQTFREAGYDLVNGTDGGGGIPGTKRSEETRRQISAANKGKKRSAEQCAALAVAQKGKIISLEHRSNLSKAGMGRVVSEETRIKIGNSNRGKRRSAEAKLKLSEAHKGIKPSPETLAKRSAKLLGRKDSPETREKKRLASILREANKKLLKKEAA